VQAGGEVGLGLQPAPVAQAGHHVGGDRPFVERPRTPFGDGPQRLRQRRIDEAVSLARRAPAGEESVRPGAAQLVGEVVPVGGDAMMHRPAVGGEPDRRLQQFSQRLGAVRGKQRLPGGHRAGDGHGMRRGVLEGRHPVLLVPVDRAGRGGAPRAVERDHAATPLGAAPGGRVQAEAVAADAGRLRLDHGQHGRRRNRRVQRVAAAAQHVECRQGGGRHGGRRHAVRREHRAAARQVEVAHRRAP